MGAVVHHDDKVGKDVGEIAGGDAIGVAAIGEADEALKLDADVVLYNAPFERYDEIIRMLASGKNVITPSAAFYPQNRPELGDLEAACATGATSLLGTGVNPGFAGDVLPLVASSLCARVRSVHVRELGDLRGWDPFMLTEVMKFGRSVEELEQDAAYFELMTNSFQQSCRMVAEALHFEVERVATQPSFARARRDLLDGKVKAGSVGGIRLQVSAIAKGSPVVSQDLRWRLDSDLDPEWPSNPDAGEWHVTIDGDPSVSLAASISGGSAHVGKGQLATAARMVNSIPDVCAAAPGLLTAASAPLPRCRNVPAG